MPKVSVILPIYNGEKYLGEAIDSILNQTFNDFELVIINDGSTDNSGAILEGYRSRDARIRVYYQDNQGLAATLNRAISLARGGYLARQDQDDLSLPERFEKQLAFLQTHPRHGMVGTWAAVWRGSKPTDRPLAHPAEDLILKFNLLFDNPFVHSSMMIRKETLEEIGGYSTDPTRQPPEDYELWSRIARQFRVANIPEVLHIYREVPGSMCRSAPGRSRENAVTVSVENLAWATGTADAGGAILDIAALAHGTFHLISASPRFAEGAVLLLGAADRLSDAAGADRELLRQRAQARLYSFRTNYLLYRYGTTVGKVLNRLLDLAGFSGFEGCDSRIMTVFGA